jgi:hypothetical protein
VDKYRPQDSSRRDCAQQSPVPILRRLLHEHVRRQAATYLAAGEHVVDALAILAEIEKRDAQAVHA